MFKKIVLIAMSFAIALSMCSCASEEPDSYYWELEIRPAWNYVDYGAFPQSIYLRADEKMAEPIYLGLDTSKRLGFYCRAAVKNSKDKVKEFSFLIQPDYSDQTGIRIEEYNIIDSGGNKTGTAFTHEIENYYHAIHSGLMTVQRIAGIHELKLTVPALPPYGLGKTSFNVSFLVEEDTREDAVEIVMADSVEYEKIEFAPDYKGYQFHDIYYCKHYPVFWARVKDSGEILQEIEGEFRKLDENYYFNMPLSNINGSGIYLCRIYYSGTEQYKALNYYCYIILQ